MPEKCDFCEYDVGPLKSKLDICRMCRNCDNFQVKKRMSPVMSYKYEKFIFDYFPYLEKTGIYNVKRENEYEPIKDNAEKARVAYMKKKGEI